MASSGAREEFEHSKYYYEVADVERARQMYRSVLCRSRCLPCTGSASSLRMIMSSNVRIPSTSWMRAARSVLPNVRLISEGCANWHATCCRRLCRAAQGTWNIHCLKMKSEGQRCKIKANSSIHPLIIRACILSLRDRRRRTSCDDVDTAHAQLNERIPALLKELNLEHGDVRIFATPRRLVVSIADLSPKPTRPRRPRQGSARRQGFRQGRDRITGWHGLCQKE